VLSVKSVVNSHFFNGLRRTAGVTVRATHAARRRRRAAPTAFQRTSLLMKCNITERKNKGLARGTRRMTQKGESGFFSFSACSACSAGKKFSSHLAPWQPAKPPANNLFTPLGVSTRGCQTRLRGLEPAPLRASIQIFRGENRSQPPRPPRRFT
jgi:hypothetical protein